LFVPDVDRSITAARTGAFAATVVMLGDACVVPAVVSDREFSASIGAVVSTPR